MLIVIPFISNIHLSTHHPVGGNNTVGDDFRRHKLSMLAFQINQGDPTGLATTASHVYADVLGDGLLEQISHGRPAHAVDLLGDDVFH